MIPMAAVLSRENLPAGVVLSDVARRLAAEGLRLAGVIQGSEADWHREDPDLCDLALEVLSTGERIAIAQDLGREAKGCKLDAQALEDAVGLVDRTLEGGCDMLVINKFGKREVEGAGFRQTIARAVARGVPVLVGVGRNERAGFAEFAGEDVALLPADADAVLAWCREVLAARTAA